jgi:hypothetical protein
LAFQTANGMMPLIGADMERVNSLIPLADQIAKLSGIKYTIRKFRKVEDKKSKEDWLG